MDEKNIVGQSQDAARGCAPVTGSARLGELKAFFFLWDEFRKKAPLKEITDDLNRRLRVERSEMQTREVIFSNKEPNA
jgi:hypothetical protein